MTQLVCPSCGTTKNGAFKPTSDECACTCGGRMVEPWTLKPRKSLNRSKAPQSRKRSSSLKEGRGFAVTKAQREKVAGLPCVGCGRVKSGYVSIDPAHIWSEGCRCTSPLCIIPLCRALDYSCHVPYDKRDLDLLSKLIDAGYYAELGHVVEAHEVSPLTLVERTTGQRYAPVEVQGVAG